MSNVNSDIDYSAAIDAALREAAGNESGAVTELEPDPVAQETEPEETGTSDIGQYFQVGAETLETSEEGLQEQKAAVAEGEQDPPTIEERLDDLTDLLGGLQELVKQLVGNMETQSKSIDSIGSRVIGAVQTVLQHGGMRLPPAAPKPAPAVVEEAPEKGPSEAEKQNLETITKLKERRS